MCFPDISTGWSEVETVLAVETLAAAKLMGEGGWMIPASSRVEWIYSEFEGAFTGQAVSAEIIDK